ncbi:MAG: amidohydrolase [Pirellulaceae bacterium]
MCIFVLRILRRSALSVPIALGWLTMLAAAPDAAGQQVDVTPLGSVIDSSCSDVESRVIAWRRDIHQHPELSNREVRTAKLVADHLRQLGLEVKTEVAHTGVVGILRGSSTDRVVALRADMDALPVTEAVDVPFASKVTTQYAGQTVGVMHACGHDAHVAILMGVAEVLSKVSDRLPGTVKFIFQPAEEGAPAGEAGGAALMIREGVLDAPRPQAIFGLHVVPLPAGHIGYRSGPVLASADRLQIVVRGRQTHGAMPWAGIDSITVAAQIVLGLQTIVSRQMDLTAAPAVISLGSIHGGVRENIIPGEVEMLGTIRVLDPDSRATIHARITNTAEKIAESAGATAEVTIGTGYPVTVNDPGLTQRMVPVLQEVCGKDAVHAVPPLTVAEDFAYYQQQIPGMFFLLGITPLGTDPSQAAPNHSPHFFVDESALVVGVRALCHLAVEQLANE